MPSLSDIFDQADDLFNLSYEFSIYQRQPGRHFDYISLVKAATLRREETEFILLCTGQPEPEGIFLEIRFEG